MLLARCSSQCLLFLNRAILDILFSVDAAPALPRRVSSFVLSFCSLLLIDVDRAFSINLRHRSSSNLVAQRASSLNKAPGAFSPRLPGPITPAKFENRVNHRPSRKRTCHLRTSFADTNTVASSGIIAFSLSLHPARYLSARHMLERMRLMPSAPARTVTSAAPQLLKWYSVCKQKIMHRMPGYSWHAGLTDLSARQRS